MNVENQSEERQTVRFYQMLSDFVMFSTLMSLITVQVRLFILRKSSSLYALIRDMFFGDYGTLLTCTLILFGEFVILYGY